MIIYLYPDKHIDNINNNEEHKGPIIRFLEKLQNDRPELWTLVDETFKKVKRAPNLIFLEKNKWVKKIKGKNSPIKEFRIPPHRHGGVVRLYFAHKKNDANTIFILSAELKQGKTDADESMLKQAKRRYKEVCLWMNDK